MWHSITENIEFLESVVKKNNLKFDYVCRFRTDIMTLKEIKHLKKDLEKIENNQILFSSNRHFRGITDLFFIGKYNLLESEYLQIMDVSSNTISLKREPYYEIGANLSGTITQITLAPNSGRRRGLRASYA